jgi:hypothetical protein
MGASKKIAVTLPDAATYAWWMARGGKTSLHTAKSKIWVPANTIVKITAFATDNGIEKNLGTAIFTASPGETSEVALRWPVMSTQAPVTLHDKRHTITVEGSVIDHAPEWGRELRAANAGLGHIGGMNKFWNIDWQWPFRTPGWLGLRESDEAPPGLKAALPWLEFHALSCLGLPSLGSCTPEEQLSVVSVALGAAGYLDGYDHEDVDDTAALWCSFGTGNDCDDFAMAVCATVRAILRGVGSGCALEAWVRNHVTDVYVVNGWAWPRQERDAFGRKKKFGHMWCEAVLTDGDKLTIECTSAVAYYGGEPVAANVRKGVARGEDSEYLTHEYHWYHDRAYKIVDGERRLLPQPKVPAWLTELRYTVPDESLDKAYTPPRPPPAPIAASGFGNRRQLKGAAERVAVRLWPFRTTDGVVVWTRGSVDDERKQGAY